MLPLDARSATGSGDDAQCAPTGSQALFHVCQTAAARRCGGIKSCAVIFDDKSQDRGTGIDTDMDIGSHRMPDDVVQCLFDHQKQCPGNLGAKTQLPGCVGDHEVELYIGTVRQVVCEDAEAVSQLSHGIVSRIERPDDVAHAFDKLP